MIRDKRGKKGKEGHLWSEGRKPAIPGQEAPPPQKKKKRGGTHGHEEKNRGGVGLNRLAPHGNHREQPEGFEERDEKIYLRARDAGES